MDPVSESENALEDLQKNISYYFKAENIGLLERARTRKKYYEDVAHSQGEYQDELSLMGDWILRRYLVERLIGMFHKQNGKLISLLEKMNADFNKDWKLDTCSLNDCVSKAASVLQDSQTLTSIGKSMKLDQPFLIKTNKSEADDLKKGMPDNRILSETVEAIIATIDKDGGSEAVEKVLNIWFLKVIG